MAAGYKVGIHNNSSGNVTVARATGGDTINGAAKNIVLPAGQRANFRVNAAANGYLIENATGGLFLDPTDPSKQAKWDLSGVTTGTVITLTPPAAGGTLLSTTSSLTGAQSSEVLIGAIQTANNSATIDFTSTSYATAFDGSLGEITFHWEGVRPANDAVQFEAQAGTGAGPTWHSGGTDYEDGGVKIDNTGAVTGTGTATRAYIPLSGGSMIGNAATKPSNGRAILSPSPANTAFHKGVKIDCWQVTSAGTIENFNGSSRYLATTAWTGVRFLMGAGNIAEGKFWVTGKRLA